jgi:RNA polymerase sigma factor (sigma-70 family)
MKGDLLARLKAREPRAQREFREKFLPALVPVCERVLGNAMRAREVAEDVITDVAMAHVDRIRLEHSLAAYLRLMALRRSARLKAVLDRQDELGDHLDRGEGPEAELLRADEAHRWRERIGRCMDRLRPRIRAVLRMRFHDDATQEAIGSVLGVSKQYVGKVIAQALLSLKACLEASRE